jgi:exonuclease III
MICLSFNYRGLKCLVKNNFLKKMIETYKIDIMLLQESMGDGSKLVFEL